uniref:Trithorax group protein osa n=1 Tax=Mesocestoides corti TaxID=53468 RepID=A0A5K3F8U5_MESCO
MKTCLSDGSSDSNKSLPRLWSRFIDALTLTTKRLERTFNFATVNKDLHIFLSEAITFVHQKYAQVKSSLIQECKSSAGGRGSGASNAPPPYNLSPSGWQYPSRLRRSADNASSAADALLRERRQSGYPGEAWRQSEPPGWGASQQPPPRGGGGGAYQPYFQPGRRSGGNPSMQPSQQPQQQHSANAPEKLNKWATQLKFYYSGVKDLFARPPSTVCAPAAQSNTACWNPPPVASSGQPHRRLAALSDLVAASDRLSVVNTKNNGDPDALESGARILAELKMRNTSTHGSRGSPSLLQPRNSGMPSYGQSHDPWRIGGNNFPPPQPPQPAAPYQPQPVGEPFSNNMNIDVAGSGYEPAGVAPQPGYPPTLGQPPYSLQPERPDQAGYPSHRAPIPAPGGNQPPPPLNQRWPGAGDMESSGYGREGEEESWNRGDLWQQPPPPSHPWEQPPPPAPGGGGGVDGGNYQWPNSYYPDQQGSGEPFLPGPEAYPQPVETSTTTSTTLTSTTSGPTTVASEPPFTMPPTPASSVESTSGVNTSTIQTLPPPPPLPPSIGGFDDEDFGQPTPQPQPLPTSTQRPWDARQPSPPFGLETSGYYPGGEGASRPLGPHAPLPLPQGPPDCSPEAMASAGSGVDPRCLSERGGVEEGRPAYPHAGLPGWEPQPPDLEDHRAGSGGGPDGLEPPPPPPHYPGYVDESHPREPTDYGSLPDLDRLIPQTETSLPPTGPDTYQPHPPASKPLDTTPPTRVAPPDVWLPAPELQPGDGKLPDSKLFLPDFPPHRGRPMSGDSKVTTGGLMVTKTPALIATLLLIAILV